MEINQTWSVSPGTSQRVLGSTEQGKSLLRFHLKGNRGRNSAGADLRAVTSGPTDVGQQEFRKGDQCERLRARNGMSGWEISGRTGCAGCVSGGGWRCHQSHPTKYHQWVESIGPWGSHYSRRCLFFSLSISSYLGFLFLFLPYSLSILKSISISIFVWVKY